MDEKDREIQELRRQVESIKVEPVRRGQWLEGTPGGPGLCVFGLRLGNGL